MRKTYAYNSIIIGGLLALLVYLTSNSIPLTILTGVGVSVGGFIVIRLIENAIYKGVDKAVDKIHDAYQQRKEQKIISNGTLSNTQTTQMPDRNTTQFPQKTEGSAESGTSLCPNCGAKITARAKYCPACGKSV